MDNLSQLQRAKLVVEQFVPRDKPGENYVYVYLGQASWDATQYKLCGSEYLMSRRVWFIDETKIDCVCYAGRGKKNRINDPQYHSVLPSYNLRIKLRTELSFEDSVRLEKILIQKLGCICDRDREDGCLVNMRYYEQGPWCCTLLEAEIYQKKQASAKSAEYSTADVICMDENRRIITQGGVSEIGRRMKIHPSNISACCKGKRRGIWQPQEKRALYFCYANEYENYKIKAMTSQQLQRTKVLLAQKLDGSDICCGTATEIAKYANLKRSERLHTVARYQMSFTEGWTARYVDEFAEELEAPLATCGPNLSVIY